MKMKQYHKAKALTTAPILLALTGCVTPSLESYVRGNETPLMRRYQEGLEHKGVEEAVRPSQAEERRENFVTRTLYFEADIEKGVKSVRVGNMYYSIAPEDLASLQKLAVYVNEGKGFDANKATFSGKFDASREGHVRALQTILGSIDDEFTGEISPRMAKRFVDSRAEKYQREKWLENRTLIENKFGYIARVWEHLLVESTAAYRVFGGEIVEEKGSLVVKPKGGLEDYTGDLDNLLKETYEAFDGNGDKDITPEEVEVVLKGVQEGTFSFENDILVD